MTSWFSRSEPSERQFVRSFLAVLVAGMVVTICSALIIDPMGAFGTGIVKPMIAYDRIEKPRLFLAASPQPQAIVLGSSRTYKLSPSCLRELTGLPAFNFGFGFALVEDWVAAYRFAKAETHGGIREVIIGVDTEAFDDANQVDPQLTSSRYLREFNPTTSASDGRLRALLGWQAFRTGILSLRYNLEGRHHQSGDRLLPDGYKVFEEWEHELAAGTLPRAELEKGCEQQYGPTTWVSFTSLSPRRVAMFEDLVRDAHASGARVDVTILPVSPRVAAIRDQGNYRARLAEVDSMLSSLERAGLVRYLKFDTIAAIGGDPDGYFDGVHMTDPNARTVLLSMFHATHGCEN